MISVALRFSLALGGLICYLVLLITLENLFLGPSPHGFLLRGLQRDVLALIYCDSHGDAGDFISRGHVAAHLPLLHFLRKDRQD